MAKRPAAATAKPKPAVKKPEKSGKAEAKAKAKTTKEGAGGAGAVPSKTEKMKAPKIYKERFARIYPRYIALAKETGHTMAEVDQIITWLTGYKVENIHRHVCRRTELEEFFAEAKLNPKRKLITGSVGGERVESIEDKTVRELRYMDKLIDELVEGTAMDKILRKTLHSTLAILAWPQAMNSGLLDHGKGRHNFDLGGALAEDATRDSIELSLAHFEKTCVDAGVKVLAESLSPNIENLKLSFEGCIQLTDASLRGLASHLPDVRTLYLDFVGCENLTDVGLKALAESLPDTLTEALSKKLQATNSLRELKGFRTETRHHVDLGEWRVQPALKVESL
eukprot:s2962_g6.t1